MLALRYRKLWFGGGVLLILAVLLLSVVPFTQMPVPPSLQDKTGHTIAYLVLMVWFCGLWPRGAHWRLALVFVLMGASLEFVQSFIPSRFADSNDMLANTLGVLSGWVVARLGVERWARVIERLVFGVAEPVDG